MCICTAIMHREGSIYVADCPEVGTVSQGYSIDEAMANIKEATQLYLEEFPRSPIGTDLVDSSDMPEHVETFTIP